MFEEIGEGVERRRGHRREQKRAKKGNFRPRIKPNKWQARQNELIKIPNAMQDIPGCREGKRR